MTGTVDLHETREIAVLYPAHNLRSIPRSSPRSIPRSSQLTVSDFSFNPIAFGFYGSNGAGIWFFDKRNGVFGATTSEFV